MSSFLGVPDVVWSGVIGSSIAFVGVALSNRSNTGRLERQLHHDANEKSIQRRNEVRKAVYLEFAEQFASANSFIGSMSNIDMASQPDLSEGIRPFQAAAAKAQLIADIGTVKFISDLLKTHTKFFIKGVTKVIPINKLKADIKMQGQVYDTAQAEMKRILSEMSTLNETASTNHTRFSALNLSFSVQRDISNCASQKITELYAALTQLQIEYLQFSTSNISDVMRASAPVMAALRRDLEIDGYTVDFEKQFAERLETTQAEVRAVLAEFVSTVTGTAPPK